MNIEHTLMPNSEQLDAIELASGPRTFQIERVTKNSDEQPINVHFVDFPRPWRPSKNMRRVMAACWSKDAAQWVDHKVTLFFDPTVTFGKEQPGGTRISHLSHIDGPKKIPVLIGRGRSAVITVQPLADDAPPTADKKIADAIAHYRTVHNVTVAQIEKYIGAPSSDWSATDIASLRALSGELARGEKTVADVFDQANGEAQ